MGYTCCIVPLCKNSKTKTPQKTFIIVPREPKKRRMWLKAVRRDQKDYSSKTSGLYVCEDHFNLEEDMENYLEWKTMGCRKLLKRNVIPHRFDCQEDTPRERTAVVSIAASNTTVDVEVPGHKVFIVDLPNLKTEMEFEETPDANTDDLSDEDHKVILDRLPHVTTEEEVPEKKPKIFSDEVDEIVLDGLPLMDQTTQNGSVTTDIEVDVEEILDKEPKKIVLDKLFPAVTTKVKDEVEEVPDEKLAIFSDQDHKIILDELPFAITKVEEISDVEFDGLTEEDYQITSDESPSVTTKVESKSVGVQANLRPSFRSKGVQCKRKTTFFCQHCCKYVNET